MIRLGFLRRSIQNEKRLKAAGAVEYGAGVTKALTLAHVIYYLTALIQGLRHGLVMDHVFLFGLLLYVFGIAILVWVVKALGPVWTIKLMMARDHVLHQGWLFRTFKHPNYFLNIVPELVGLGLMFHAFRLIEISLPLYCIPLGVRIVQESTVMRQRFAQY